MVSLLTNLLVSVRPAMEAEGLVTTAEVQVETLYQRVMDEVVAGGCNGDREVGDRRVVGDLGARALRTAPFKNKKEGT
jgi:hypothetical protein